MRITDMALGGWIEEPVAPRTPKTVEEIDAYKAAQALEAERVAIEVQIRNLQSRPYGMGDAAALQRRNERIEELEAQLAAIPTRATISRYVEPIERDLHQDGTSYDPWAPNR